MPIHAGPGSAQRGRRRVAVVAYTDYRSDSRVRRESEALVEAGYLVDAIVLDSGMSPHSLNMAGVNVHELPLQARRGSRARYLYQYGLFFLLSTSLLLRLAVRNRFDLVQVHSLPDFQVACALPLKVIGRTAILLDLHEAMPEIFSARFDRDSRSLGSRCARFLEKLSCRIADRIIVANDGIKAAVVARGVPAERITAVYNPGDLLVHTPSPESIRAELRLPSGPLIVHAGGINPERDLETLLEALARLPSDSWGSLVVAGEGDPRYVESLIHQSERLGLSLRVVFVGKLPPEGARALMALSSVGLVTLESNPLTELSWPTRIVEFANLHKPLLVPRLRFLSQVLGDAAAYYEPGDPVSLATALDDVLKDQARTESVISRAEQICKRFEWLRMREVLLETYRSIEVHG